MADTMTPKEAMRRIAALEAERDAALAQVGALREALADMLAEGSKVIVREYVDTRALNTTCDKARDLLAAPAPDADLMAAERRLARAHAHHMDLIECPDRCVGVDELWDAAQESIHARDAYRAARAATQLVVDLRDRAAVVSAAVRLAEAYEAWRRAIARRSAAWEKGVPDAEWGVIQNALASAIDTLHTALAAYRAARDAAQQKGSE
jgi:hypothetical protein